MITEGSHPHISDAAKRIHDEYSLHRLAAPYDSIGKWFAARLNDGTSDHVLYDSKQEAVRHQHHDELFYMFVQVGPYTMSYKEAETMLRLMRKASDMGLRLADRDETGGGKDIIRRVTQEDQYNQMRAMFVGDRPPTNISYRK